MAEKNEGKFSFAEKVRHLKSEYFNSGITGVAQQLQDLLCGWKGETLKIAVTGRSGSGKSTFINAIRGISADDEELDPAPVGVVETTKEVKSYKYQGNDNFLLFDLPGLGTPMFNQKTYMADIKSEIYDFFIIIAKDRFTEHDLWLAKQIIALNKPFYFVRSHVAENICSNKKAYKKKPYNEKAVLTTMKEDIKSNLKDLKECEIYMIDSYETNLYDFGLLTKRMMEDSNEMKRDALTFSLSCLSKEVIEEKREQLAKRIPWVAALCGILPSVEIPLPVIPSDGDIVKQEINFYREQFGIDSEQLKEGCEKTDLPDRWHETVSENVSSQENMLYEKAKKGIMDITSLIPVVGNVVKGCKCAKSLTESLDQIANTAVKIHEDLTAGLARASIK